MLAWSGRPEMQIAACGREPILSHRGSGEIGPRGHRRHLWKTGIAGISIPSPRHSASSSDINLEILIIWTAMATGRPVRVCPVDRSLYSRSVSTTYQTLIFRSMKTNLRRGTALPTSRSPMRLMPFLMSWTTVPTTWQPSGIGFANRSRPRTWTRANPSSHDPMNRPDTSLLDSENMPGPSGMPVRRWAISRDFRPGSRGWPRRSGPLGLTIVRYVCTYANYRNPELSLAAFTMFGSSLDDDTLTEENS